MVGGIRRSRMCVLLVGLAAAWLGSAPAVALDPERSIRQYRHTKWTAADGAPPAIYSLAQGRDGYLWIGSAGGLYRFDGVSFERMALTEPDTRGWRAYSVLATRDGSTWVGYHSGRIAIYRDGALRLDRSAPQSDSAITDLVQTRDGTVWAKIQRVGVWLMRHSQGRWEPIDARWGLPQQSTGRILAAPDGALWVESEGQILVLREGARRFEQVGSQEGGGTFGIDSAGRVWIVGDRGARVVSGSPARASFVAGTPRSSVVPHRTQFDRDGNLWAVNSDGVFRVRTSAGASGLSSGPLALDHFGAIDGLTTSLTNTVFEDREGNIWVGTSFGLDRFSPARIVKEPLLRDFPRTGFTLLGASDGMIYVGAADGLYRVAPGRAPRQIASTLGVGLICEDGDRGIWAFSRDEALHIAAGRVRRAVADEVLAAHRAGRMLDGCAVDRFGTLWVNATEAGLFSYAHGRWRHHPPRGDRWAMMMTSGSGGRPLVWLKAGVLAQLNGEGRPGASLLERRSADMHFLHQGAEDIFFGGPFGIGRVRGGRLQIAAADRLPWLTDTYGMVDTPRGETWLLGLAGIVGVRTTELGRAFVDATDRPRATVLGFEDGLPNIRSVLRRAVALGGDGRVWFATMGGVVWIDPSHLQPNTMPPPVRISALVANGTLHRDPTSVTLARGTSSVAIRYAGLSFTVPQRVRFRYRLEGLDDGDWIDAGPRREAFYTNLGPGTYRFQVIAANNDGVWNREGATLEFTIPPTFFQSIWFKLLCALALVVLATLGYRFRMRQVTARLQSRFDARIAERERIARELHDTLLQGFQGLMLRFQAMANRVPKGDGVREDLEHALEQAESVLVDGRARVRDLRRPSPARDLADALRDAGSAIGREVAVTVDGTPRPLHSLVREESFAIGEEAIRNAAQHAHASRIDVSLRYGAREFVLVVKDDGVGLPACVLSSGQRDGHFGLIGMRERAERIDGRLAMTSEPGAGTAVTLMLSGRAAYAARRRAWFGGAL